MPKKTKRTPAKNPLSQSQKILFAKATYAMKNAHAPYSKYQVGAALLDSRGRIYHGCNVENSTFGATVCAERSAVSAMVSDGGKEVKEVVVVTSKGWLPCGICRQVLLEFSKKPGELKIHVFKKSQYFDSFSLDELLPSAFGRADL